MTFAGTASDDEGLKNVEISLRNTSTGENLGNDCTWGVGISAGNCRVSPVDITGSTYNWTWTTPVQPVARHLHLHGARHRRRGPDDVVDQPGPLTINAQYAGDLPPDGTMAFTAPTDKSLTVNLAGHGHRRRRRWRACGSPCRTGTPAATCRPTARWRRRSRSATPTLTPATGDQHDAGRCRPSPCRPEATGASPRSPSTPAASRTPSPATANYQVYPGDGAPDPERDAGTAA